jgi:hypothetical protein
MIKGISEKLLYERESEGQDVEIVKIPYTLSQFERVAHQSKADDIGGVQLQPIQEKQFEVLIKSAENYDKVYIKDDSSGAFEKLSYELTSKEESVVQLTMIKGISEKLLYERESEGQDVEIVEIPYTSSQFEKVAHQSKADDIGGVQLQLIEEQQLSYKTGNSAITTPTKQQCIYSNSGSETFPLSISPNQYTKVLSSQYLRMEFMESQLYANSEDNDIYQGILKKYNVKSPENLGASDSLLCELLRKGIIIHYYEGWGNTQDSSNRNLLEVYDKLIKLLQLSPFVNKKFKCYTHNQSIKKTLNNNEVSNPDDNYNFVKDEGYDSLRNHQENSEKNTLESAKMNVDIDHPFVSPRSNYINFNEIKGLYCLTNSSKKSQLLKPWSVLCNIDQISLFQRSLEHIISILGANADNNGIDSSPENNINLLKQILAQLPEGIIVNYDSLVRLFESSSSDPYGAKQNSIISNKYLQDFKSPQNQSGANQNSIISNKYLQGNSGKSTSNIKENDELLKQNKNNFKQLDFFEE